MVEHDVANVVVVGSSPIARSSYQCRLHESPTMNWLEIQKRIELMTPEEKLKPALTYDLNEGEFCEIIAVEIWDDGTLYLDQDDKWYHA